MRLYVLILLAASLLAGCSASSLDEEDPVPTNAWEGTWTRVVDLTQLRLTINPDETFTISYDALTFNGTYRFDTNGLFVVQDEGCSTLSGTYSMTFTEEARSMILGLVSDNCRTRFDRWRGPWTRAVGN